jgi:hypothetical protein
MDFWPVLAVFVDGEDADHFVGKFFTFNHRFSRGFSVVRPLPRTGLLERIPLRFTIRGELRAFFLPRQVQTRPGA